MVTLNLLFAFVFGTIIGSFLNVAILRYGTGLGVVTKGSFCFSCKRHLSPSDLVPVFSYIFLGGKCRTCKSAISIQYPLVEVVMGLFTVGIIYKLDAFLLTSIFWTALTVAFFGVLTVISVYDLYYKIIPDPLVLALIIISALLLFVTPGNDILRMPSFDAFIAGPVFSFPFVATWFLSRGRLMGLGDGKLVIALGWFLGLQGGFSAIVLAFWIGAIFSLILMGISRIGKYGSEVLKFFGLDNISLRAEIPFGPFLALGTIIVYFFHFNVLKMPISIIFSQI